MDAVQVEINPAAQECFDQVDAVYEGFSEVLCSEFTQYKQSVKKFEDNDYMGDVYLPSIFGKDEIYTEPHGCITQEVMHIHLAMPPDEFPSNRPQSSRKCSMQHPEKDAALVYTRGYDDREHCYCILGVFYPRAHTKANDRKVMSKFVREAKDFRDRF